MGRSLSLSPLSLSVNIVLCICACQVGATARARVKVPSAKFQWRRFSNRPRSVTNDVQNGVAKSATIINVRSLWCKGRHRTEFGLAGLIFFAIPVRRCMSRRLPTRNYVDLFKLGTPLISFITYRPQSEQKAAIDLDSSDIWLIPHQTVVDSRPNIVQVSRSEVGNASSLTSTTSPLPMFV